MSRRRTEHRPGVENFEQLVRRVAQMISYGMSRDDVIERLLDEGLTEDQILLAWVAGKMAFEDTQR